MMRIFLCICFILHATNAFIQNPGATLSPQGYFDFEWNALMMQSTYQISGPNGKGQHLSGTVFILGLSPTGKPLAGEPFHGVATTANSTPILITAAHVMNEIVGQTATLKMHFQDESGSWQVVEIPLHIRQGMKPLWLQHPVGDVAILPLTESRVLSHLPALLLGTNYLATDKWMTDFQLHPGDEVVCLGFPEEVQSAYGFPILRIGRIASYPIVPSAYTRPLYIDFPVYGGNSGGPAYISMSGTRGKVLLSTTNPPEIIGLVIQKRYERPSDHDAVSSTPNNENPQALADMHLAVYEPSTVIAETIAMLPH
jgi:hypothetical protein